MQTMKLRTEYKFKLPKDVKIDYRDYEASIVKAAAKVAPDKQVTVYEDHFAIDRLTRGGSIALGRAMAKDRTLSGWSVYSDDIVFCRITGEPVNREEFYRLAVLQCQKNREEAGVEWENEENVDL